MKRAALLFVLCYVLHASAFAFSVSNMQNTLSGVIQSKTAQRGFQPSYPSVPSTLAAVGGAIAGYAASSVAVTVAGVTAPAWLTVGIAAGVGVLATAGLNWLMNNDGTVKYPDANSNFPAGPAQLVYCMGLQCAPTKQQACNRDAGTWSNPDGSSGVKKFQWVDATQTCDLFRMQTSPTAGAWNDAGDLGGFNMYASGCPGIDLSPTGGQCPASNFPAQIGSVVPYSDAVDAISPQTKQQPVNPQIIADMANKMWMGAASQPGYSGVPFDASNPITSADVNTWRSANPSYYPTFGEMLSPQAAPSGGTSATPFTLPSSPTPQAQSDPSAPSNVTNPAAENPQANLGPDPNIGMPTLEAIPTVPMILDPIFNMLPGLRSFSVASHNAVCPTGSINLFNHVQSISAQCDLLEGVRNIIAVVMAFVWSFAALRISLSA